ncbi:MAG TPA: hypothetical protein VE396_03570 [Xanthobacteraceae bacterium]|jgi:type IV secretory pathway VirB10-like protein|nr:hypothetical protein [Xanthobacteraceae bacterium]
MDILAPVLAYLTCVAGIVGAFAVSFFVVFSTPNQPAIPQHSAAAAIVSPLKTAALVEANKPATKDSQADKPAVNYVAPTTQKREAAPRASAVQAAAAQAPAAQPAAQKLAAIDARQKPKISRAQWRQIVAQERSRRLAYQQGADFETRFLGYAD